VRPSRPVELSRGSNLRQVLWFSSSVGVGVAVAAQSGPSAAVAAVDTLQTSCRFQRCLQPWPLQLAQEAWHHHRPREATLLSVLTGRDRLSDIADPEAPASAAAAAAWREQGGPPACQVRRVVELEPLVQDLFMAAAAVRLAAARRTGARPCMAAAAGPAPPPPPSVWEERRFMEAPVGRHRVDPESFLEEVAPAPPAQAPPAASA